MRLRNKKTGEIYYMYSESVNSGGKPQIILFPRGQIQPIKKAYRYDTLAELNEDWEDYDDNEKRKKMKKTKFVAKKYFDYHLERKEVFDSKEECEKFIDEKNKELAHWPHTWWEGYTEMIEE